MNDIQSKADIITFVDTFYEKVKVNAIIGPVFHSHMTSGNWSAHLERMYSFWNTVLFAEVDYRGNPFAKHTNLPIEKIHFDTWTSIFKATIRSLYEGPVTEDAIQRVEKMSLLFQSKLEHLRKDKNFHNLM